MARCSCLLGLLVFVTILEAMIFAVIYAGWSSYIYVLMDQGFYAELCSLRNDSNRSNDSFLSIFTNISQHLHEEKTSNITKLLSRAAFASCEEQQERLNLLYSISVGMVSVISVLLGPLIYRFGLIVSKILSMMLFISGCVFLGFSNADIPLMIVPGLVFTGIGGLALININMKVTFILPFGAGLYVAVLNGACDSSVITFRIVKLLHETGLPDLYTYMGIIVVHAIIGGSSLILHEIVDKRKAVVVHVMEKSYIDLNSKTVPPVVREPVDSLRHSLCSFVTFSMLLWLSILMLYFYMYLGTINSRLHNFNQDRVSHITNVMAYIMLTGLATAFIPGSIAEWQTMIFKARTTCLERRLLPNVFSLATTSLLAVLLNILSFTESEVIFYIEFAVLTVFRSFLFSSNMSFIATAFPESHVNIMFPLSLATGGTASMLQYAIFVWNNQSFIIVRVFLTLLVTSSLIHPAVVYMKAKGILKKTCFCCYATQKSLDKGIKLKLENYVTHM